MNEVRKLDTAGLVGGPEGWTRRTATEVRVAGEGGSCPQKCLYLIFKR